jgi:membrane protein required for beta-lactamase induction
MDMLEKIHILGATAQDFICALQNGMQFKTYELFISGIFHFIIFGCG